jgi:hypothetical protein
MKAPLVSTANGRVAVFVAAAGHVTTPPELDPEPEPELEEPDDEPEELLPEEEPEEDEPELDPELDDPDDDPELLPLDEPPSSDDGLPLVSEEAQAPCIAMAHTPRTAHDANEPMLFRRAGEVPADGRFFGSMGRPSPTRNCTAYAGLCGAASPSDATETSRKIPRNLARRIALQVTAGVLSAIAPAVSVWCALRAVGRAARGPQSLWRPRIV